MNDHDTGIVLGFLIVTSGICALGAEFGSRGLFVFGLLWWIVVVFAARTPK